MEQWWQSHWVGIGVIYLMVIKVLTAIQDAIDATPKDAPILRKIVNVMNAVAQQIFLGNRPTQIGGNK